MTAYRTSRCGATVNFSHALTARHIDVSIHEQTCGVDDLLQIADYFRLVARSLANGLGLPLEGPDDNDSRR